MLAARDQENFVHGQQTAAAAKPLNQGIHGLAAKTPGNKAPKTPFKVALNDENATFRSGKSVLKTNGKGNENLFTGGKKGAELDKNTFVTPAGPRTRAPLGMKTTNAKTKAFQTPAPPSADTASAKTQPQSRSPRLRRAKVKVLQTEDAKAAAEPEEREIEYMPPRGEPLPDLPDDYWGPEKTFPMFEGANYTRGMWSHHFNPVGDDGVSRLEREDAAREERIRKETDEMLQKACDEMFEEAVASIMGTAASSKPTTRPPPSTSTSTANTKPSAPPTGKPITHPSTLTSRTAATALRQPPPSSRSYSAAPTTAPKSRLPSAFPLSRKKQPQTTPQPTNPSSMRHTAATAASRTTLGYANGRAASSSLRRPLSDAGRTQGQKRSVSTPVGVVRRGEDATVTPAKRSEEEELVEMLRARGLEAADEEGVDDGEELVGGGIPDLEDEYEGFQLAVPEL